MTFLIFSGPYLVKKVDSKFFSFLSECTTNSDCTEDNRKTCINTACVCDFGFVEFRDGCINGSAGSFREMF